MSLVPAPPQKKSKLCQQLSEHKTLDCLLSFALSFHTMTKNCLPPSFLSLSQQSVIKDNCVNLKNQEHFDMSLTFSLCDDQSDRIPNHKKQLRDAKVIAVAVCGFLIFLFDWLSLTTQYLTF